MPSAFHASIECRSEFLSNASGFIVSFTPWTTRRAWNIAIPVRHSPNFATFSVTFRVPFNASGVNFLFQLAYSSGSIYCRRPVLRSIHNTSADPPAPLRPLECPPSPRANCHVKFVNGNCTCVPQLIGIGVEKAGTTSIWHWLLYHPDFVQSSSFFKELRYFFDTRSKEPYPFLTYFPYVDPAGRQVTGLISPEYILERNAPLVLSECCSGSLFFVSLREPAYRAYSQFAMDFANASLSEFHQLTVREMAAIDSFFALTRGYEDVTWDELFLYLRRQEIMSRYSLPPTYTFWVSNGLYALQLQSWLHLIPRNRWFFMDFAEIASSPVSLMERLTAALGLSPLNWSEIVKEHWGTKSSPPEAKDTLQLLRRYYRAWNNKLADITDLQFPSQWNREIDG
jgi:hypothetical protein